MAMTQEDFDREEVFHVPLEQVEQFPWRYYGKFLQASGRVRSITPHPPGGRKSNRYAGGEEITEFTISSTEYFVTFSFLHLGYSGDIATYDDVTVVGLPVGRRPFGSTLVLVGR